MDTLVVGSTYMEMVHNIVLPMPNNPVCSLIRFNIQHVSLSNTNALIGGAVDILILDSKLFF